MHHFVTEMCARLPYMGLVHFGVCATGLISGQELGCFLGVVNFDLSGPRTPGVEFHYTWWGHQINSREIAYFIYILNFSEIFCETWIKIYMLIFIQDNAVDHVFSCDQAALQMVFSVCPSVRLSVRPSVRHTFLTMFPSLYHHEIFRSYYQWQKWRPCKRSRSKVKVTEVTTQLYGFRTVTPVWIHVWWWNDAYCLIMLRRGALLFFKVICQISRSHGSKNRRIWPRLGVSGL